MKALFLAFAFIQAASADVHTFLKDPVFRADLYASCRSAVNPKVYNDSMVIYSGQECLNDIRNKMPGFVFEANLYEVPVHSGSIPELYIKPISFKAPSFDLKDRIYRISQTSCVTRVLSIPQVMKESFGNKFFREDLVKLTDHSRWFVVTVKNEVTGWRELEACVEDMKKLLPENGLGQATGGTPYVLDRIAGHVIVRFLK